MSARPAVAMMSGESPKQAVPIQPRRKRIATFSFKVRALFALPMWNPISIHCCECTYHVLHSMRSTRDENIAC
jgi:hypothetical protein